ncbi:MAG: IS66 family insertion sequence element accessory protein TnpB [Planctomycetaceae bacterium]|nr:IS66 family insertion sequence element accessory protein TnpB [Planctomycetaceae bacterium]
MQHEFNTLAGDPFCGHLFVFRGGRRGDLLKIIWRDSQGACLFSKRLEKGRFGISQTQTCYHTVRGKRVKYCQYRALQTMP